MDLILKVTDLVKTYGNSRKGKAFMLQINSFEVQEGSFTAILGPNGSGKSTFIKTIMDLIFANKGNIMLLGKDHKDKASRKNLSYLPENFLFPKNFTIREMLHLFGDINNYGQQDRKKKIAKLATAFNVDYLDKKMKNLSKGMRQTAALMYTFLGHQKFYILDEPFNGLDAVQKKAVLDYIFALRKNENITVLITTHILSDIEKICEQLHLIREGKIIHSAAKEEIDQQFNSVEDYYLSHFQFK